MPENAAALRCTHRGLRRLVGLRNAYYHGAGRIVGTVSEKRVPVDRPLARRVFLFDERTQVLVRETWSDAQTGAYAFEYLREDVRYMVLAYDYQGNYRAVVADGITTEPMS